MRPSKRYVQIRATDFNGNTTFTFKTLYFTVQNWFVWGCFDCLWFYLFCLFVFVMFFFRQVLVPVTKLLYCFQAVWLLGLFCFLFSKSSRQSNSARFSSFLKQNYLFHFAGYSLVPEQLMFTLVRLHIK